MQYSLTPADTLSIFQDEVSTFKGSVTDHFQDERRLFARAVLPLEKEVRPKDAVNGGVALRQVNDQVSIYPFLLRQVCVNGSVMAHGSRAQACDLSLSNNFSAATQIRETVRACAAPELFDAVIEEVKKSPRETADDLLRILPRIESLLASNHPRVVRRIMRRFNRYEEQSFFGMMNAITDTARDLNDPEERWKLEKLGGAVGVGDLALLLAPPPAAAASLPRKRKSREKTAHAREVVTHET